MQAVEPEGPLGVEQFVGELCGAADHRGAVPAGGGLERGGADGEPAPARGLELRVLVELRVDRTRGGGIGADVEVGGDAQRQLAGVAGAFAGGAVGVGPWPQVLQRPQPTDRARSGRDLDPLRRAFPGF